ncbi:iron-containing alcohol dehydrogenase [Fictibacillus sp. WQ 8-8]|uniref:iron-containing alcohol dehydrogenase n=1 Tax=Fictibacillus sp. WQ 8-8 TaxID=2938788 RepID=UPI0021099FA3|nr:iron-containing alcohol dehydrogenase [Fictibacillus sp. WQ 8-8]MCQ6268120.1 iron-containing alcohol dehydrogenase [Fictibacillus sp. WQ 8-8]
MVQKLEALLRRLPASHPRRQEMADQLAKRMAGYKGELSIDYHLRPLLKKGYLILQAVELIAQNLTVAVQQGSNLETRSNMLLASLLAGIAFSNAGTAAAHALGYPIGAVGKSPHGECHPRGSNCEKNIWSN